MVVPVGGSNLHQAYAGTYGIGKAAIAHFIFDLPKEKLADFYEKSMKEK